MITEATLISNLSLEKMPTILIDQDRKEKVQTLCQWKYLQKGFDRKLWYSGGIVEDNATMSSIPYFENHLSYLVQNRRK